MTEARIPASTIGSGTPATPSAAAERHAAEEAGRQRAAAPRPPSSPAQSPTATIASRWSSPPKRMQEAGEEAVHMVGAGMGQRGKRRQSSAGSKAPAHHAACRGRCRPP